MRISLVDVGIYIRKDFKGFLFERLKFDNSKSNKMDSFYFMNKRSKLFKVLKLVVCNFFI